MSESHYWPLSGEIGVYDIDHDSGAVWKEAMWTGDGWVAKGKMAPPISQTEAIAMGYLGVRREQAKIDEHAEEIAQLKADAAKARADVFDWMRVVGEREAEIKQLRDEIASVREKASTPDLTALVREAIAEFRRDVKQPTQAADWAFRWANRFIEAVER